MKVRPVARTEFRWTPLQDLNDLLAIEVYRARLSVYNDIVTYSTLTSHILGQGPGSPFGGYHLCLCRPMGQIARPHNDRSAGMDWVVRVQVGTGEVWRFPATTGFQLDSYTIDMLPDLSTPYEHRLSWNRMTISERCFARDPPERPAILEIMVPIKPIGSSSTAYIFRHQDLPPEVISARIKSNRHELPVSEWQPSSMLSVPIETECAIDILFRDGTTTTLSIKVTRASDD